MSISSPNHAVNHQLPYVPPTTETTKVNKRIHTCGRLPNEHTVTINSVAIYSFKNTSNTSWPAPVLRKLKASFAVSDVALETRK